VRFEVQIDRDKNRQSGFLRKTCRGGCRFIGNIYDDFSTLLFHKTIRLIQIENDSESKVLDLTAKHLSLAVTSRRRGFL